MKKHLLTALLSFVCCLSLRADLIFYESFAYPNGCIETNSTSWICHSPSPALRDSLVANNKLEIGNSPSRQDDIHRDFHAFTNTQMVVYSSFTLNCTNLPNANGAYIAHFYVNSTTFHARLFALTGNPGASPTNFSALPGTFRLGISGVFGAPNKIFPVDLATNVDYQVVIQWDPVTLFAATLWVNPISSADPSVTTSDTVTTPAASTAYAFRQPSAFGSGFFLVTNLAVATLFEEAATNVWSTNAVPPVIAYSPQSGTNFVGTSGRLSAVASGQGLASLTYQWRKNGSDITNPDGNTNVLAFPSAAQSDTGNYDVVVTTPLGLSATSAVAFLWVTNPPVPPTITQQPSGTNVYAGQTAVLKVQASGPGPIGFQWYRDNVAVSDGANFSGATTDTLTITDVRTNNGTVGTFRVDATNIFGATPSSNVVVAVTNPTPVTIAFLRTLVDPTFFLPTNTAALWSVTGIVTTHTNITTSGNSSFYMQDDTAGINVFFAGNTTARPEAGDSVTVVGPLGHFNSLLELNLNSADPVHSVTTNSHGNPIPAGIVLPLSFTNGVGYGGVGEVIRRFQGAVVTLTNVYFPTGFAGTNNFPGGANVTVTNSQGEPFTVRVDSRVGDIIGKPVPSFAWTVTGPMGFFLNSTAPNRSAGFQIVPTRYIDIVTNAPLPVIPTAAFSGPNLVLNWTAQPYMSYTVFRATNIAGPYLPLASGLTFVDTAGQYVDNSGSSTSAFYRVASP